MTEIKVPELVCKRCSHRWTPRKGLVHICPKCKSSLWDIPKGQKRLVPDKREKHKVT